MQQAVRACLSASADLTAIIPADQIWDRSQLPEADRCIMIGEGQTVFDIYHSTVHLDLHVWVQETGLVTSKQAANAIIGALDSYDWRQVAGWSISDPRVINTRYLRDPHGIYSHGIVQFRAFMVEQ